MDARLIDFGVIEIEGKRYEHDVLIEHGIVHKRKKKASKAYREEYGHTPLSVEEPIPWHGKTLYVGTGSYGSLPIMEEVYAEARRRGIELIALPTREICDRLGGRKTAEVNAILHVTC
jgi:hypothetical protein